MAQKFHIVNFGQSFAGLATVGYTLYGETGNTIASRSTSGVVEFGTGTGIYGAKITYDPFTPLLIVWDTGGATPRYAAENAQVQLSQIQDETDHIRLIWNTLRNQSESSKNMFEMLRGLKSNKNKDVEEYLKNIKESIDELSKKPVLTADDIRSLISITVEPIIKMDKPKDYSYEFKNIKTLIDNRFDDLKNKNSTETIKVMMKLDEAIKRLPSDIRIDLNLIVKQLTKIINNTQDIEALIKELPDDLRSNLVKIDDNTERVVKIVEALLSLMPQSHMIKTFNDNVSLIMDQKKKQAQLMKIRLGLK